MIKQSLKAVVLCAAVASFAPAANASSTDYKNAHLLFSTTDLVRAIDQEAKDVAEGGKNELRIVDVRSKEKFAEGHIPNAINIPFKSLTDPNAHIQGALKSDDDLSELLGSKGIDARTHIVIYDDQGGFRAARLFWLLEYYGHRKVSLLDGGVQAWVHDERALDTPVEPKAFELTDGNKVFPERSFSINLTPRRHASADYILDKRFDERTAVIDVRSQVAFDKGHIPWATNVPWKQNLDENRHIKPAHALLETYAAHGITPERNIVVHCQTGEAAAHTFFVLRLLGFNEVRTYHRSWAEWGTSDDLPKSVGS